MSDAGGLSRDVLLRVRVENLSTAGFTQVRAEVDKLTTSLEHQIAAANKGQISERELAASITKLEQASRNLTGLAGMVDQFKNFDNVIKRAEESVERARQKLTDYRTSLETTGTSSAAAERRLAQLVRGYEREQTVLATQRQAYADLSQRLQQAGIDIGNLATAEQNLRTVAEQTGQALTRLNQAKLDYAQNSRLAKEAAAAERIERQKVAETAKLEAAAIDATRAARIREAQNLRDTLHGMMTVNRQKQADQKAFYDKAVADLVTFNEQTRALNQKRLYDESAAAVSNVRASLRPPVTGAGTPISGATGAGAARAVGNAPGLLGLRPYELQNLSYQINDIVTGLASGQNIAQIFAQQGGQILQLFNRSVFSLLRFLPQIAVAAAAATVAVSALNRAFSTAASIREFTGLITLNGSALNYNATQITQLRKEIQDLGVSWKDTGSIMKLAIEAGVRPEQLKLFGEAARDLALVTGIEIPAAMQKLISTFGLGFEAVQKNDEVLKVLTQDEYKELRALSDAGQSREAAKRALDIYAERLKKAAEEAQTPWNRLVIEGGRAWRTFLDELAPQSTIDSLNTKLGELAGAIKKVNDEAANGKSSFFPWLAAAARGVAGAAGGFVLGGPVGAVAGGAYMAGKDIVPQVFGPPAPAASAPIGGRFEPGAFKLDSETLQKLGNIIAEASGMALPPGYRTEVISASRPGATVRKTGEPSEHASDRAVDVRIVDDKGQPVPGSMGAGGPLYFALDKAVEAIAAKKYPGEPIAIGSRFSDPDAGHFSMGGREAARTAGRPAATAIAQDNLEANKFLDVMKKITDEEDRRNTINRERIVELDREAAKRATREAGVYDDAKQNIAAQAAEDKARAGFAQLDRQRQQEQDALNATYGRHRDEIIAAGIAGRQREYEAQKQQAGGLVDEQKVYDAGLRAQREAQANFAKQEQSDDEARTIRKQIAALARQVELKDSTDLARALQGVNDKYVSINENLEKLAKNPLIPKEQIESLKQQVEEIKAIDIRQTTRASYEAAAKAALQTRRELVNAATNLEAAGDISITEKQEQIKKAFELTTPAILAAANAMEEFLKSTDGLKLPPDQIALMTAKIKELRSEAKYVDPFFKGLKTTFTESFTSGLDTAFNTISEAIGGAIAKTKEWKDVFVSVRQAGIQLFAQLLKDIASYILKAEAAKIASSLFSGGGGGGGIGGFFSSLLGGGSSAATGTAAASTASQTGLFGLGFLGLHRGGVVGRAAHAGVAPASWWADAPRYHNGRVVGLGADEEAAILKRGEEVLSNDDPRNILNRGSGGAINIRNVLIDDRSRVPEAMTGAHGERVIVDTLVRNAATIRELVRG